MDNFWRNKNVLTLKKLKIEKNPETFLIKNPEIPCFKTTKETFMLKN